VKLHKSGYNVNNVLIKLTPLYQYFVCYNCTLNSHEKVMHRICHIKFWISIEIQIERLFGSNLNTESVPNYLLLLKLTYTHLNTRIYRCSFKFLFKVVKSNLTFCVVCVFTLETDEWCVHNRQMNTRYNCQLGLCTKQLQFVFQCSILVDC
jgi:hypothetical protein